MLVRSTAGRITLARTVINAMPVFHMHATNEAASKYLQVDRHVMSIMHLGGG